MIDQNWFDDQLTDHLIAYECGGDSVDTNATLPPSDTQLSERALEILAKGRACIDLLRAIKPVRQTEMASALAVEGETQDSPTTTPRKISRFKIKSELGSGGFGIVYRAWDPVMRREVALKIPRIEALASPELRRRFEQEGQAAARLDHPHIATVLEAGIDGVMPYITTVYYPGVTLAAWLKRDHELISPAEAAALIEKLAQAAAHAHERGVLHRDIKPSNVLLVESAAKADSPRLREHEPKLMDFGLAKLTAETNDMTQSGMLLGTVRYMPPEQAAGRTAQIGPASDVYALGAILYELLTGQPPFAADSDLEVLRRIETVEPAKIRSTRRTVAKDLETICLKCLEKEPARRYPSARALAEDLNRYLDRRPILAKPATPRQRLVKWTRRNPQLATLAATFIVAVTCAIAGLAWSNRQIARSEQRWRQIAYASDIQVAHQAIEDHDYASAAEILARNAPQDGQVDQREFVWHFLWNFLHRESGRLPDHPEDVYGLAYFPDGTKLATACRDGLTRIWEVSSRRLLAELRDHGGEVNFVTFAPDGQQFVTGGDDGQILIRDAKDYRVLRRLPHPASPEGTIVAAAVYSPDGKTLYSACGGQIHKWDVSTGEHLLCEQAHSRTIKGLAISPDGRSLVTCDGSVYVWTSDWFEAIDNSNAGPLSQFSAVSFLPDGRLAIGDMHGEICLLDCDTYKSNKLCDLNSTKHVLALSASGDGRHLIASSADGSVEVIDFGSAFSQGIFAGHVDRVWDVKFGRAEMNSPQQARDGAVCFWTVPSSGIVEAANGSMGHASQHGHVTHLAYSADGELMAYCPHDDQIAVLNRMGQLNRLLVVDGSVTCGLALSRDGEQLFSLNRQLPSQLNSVINTWDVRSQKLLSTIAVEGHGTALSLSPDERRMAIVTRRKQATAPSVLLLDWPDGREICGLEQAAIEVARFTPDGEELIVGGTGELAFYDSMTGQKRLSVGRPIDDNFKDLDFFSDGERIATAEGRHGAAIRSRQSGEIIKRFPGQKGSVTGIAVSLDGQNVATVCDGDTLRIWHVATERILLECENIRVSPPGGMRFKPNGGELIVREGEPSQLDLSIWKRQP